MHGAYRRRFVTTLALVAAASVVFAQNAQQEAQRNAADAAWLVQALEIHPGSIVGEIGAGEGELTIAMARAVGESGRVFSNELNEKLLKTIPGAAEKAGVKNVTPVQGREADTNFPDQCCDAIFMRNVYHHFADPATMDASLFRSLKPGGRLAVIDFTPPGDEAATPADRSKDGFHGVKPASVERELKAAGFEVVSAEAKARTVMVIARRPPS